MFEKRVLTVSEVNRYLKATLQSDPILQNLWVRGEISNYKRHASSNHIYFTLKDSRSSLRCVFFHRENRWLKFAPADGMSVLVRGNISLYEKEGLYQLYVEEMQPDGVGSLYLAYEQLKQKLKREGLFDEKHKKSVPRVPRRIGLITSSTGAALRDILSTIKRRFPHVHILFFPAQVQGTAAPGQVCYAINYLNNLPFLDLIIIARGGGSFEELGAFNTEEVARAIFSSKVPIVSAIGHETDFTIADFVADLRASTPTAAAEMVVPEKDELLRRIETSRGKLKAALKRNLERERMRLKHTASPLSFRIFKERIRNRGQDLDRLTQRLTQVFMYDLKLRVADFKLLREKFEGLSPFKIMERGYSISTDERGNILRSIRQLHKGQRIKVIYRDGQAATDVKEIEVNTDGIKTET